MVNRLLDIACAMGFGYMNKVEDIKAPGENLDCMRITEDNTELYRPEESCYGNMGTGKI